MSEQTNVEREWKPRWVCPSCRSNTKSVRWSVPLLIEGRCVGIGSCTDEWHTALAGETPAPRGYTLKSLSNYFGWGLREERDIWQSACQREGLLRLCQSLLRTDKSNASTAELAIRERIAHLEAVEAENTRLRAALERLIDASIAEGCATSEKGEPDIDCLSALFDAITAARAALKGDA